MNKKKNSAQKKMPAFSLLLIDLPLSGLLTTNEQN